MPSPKPVEALDPLGRLVRTARVALGLSQEEAAKRLGIEQRDVSAVERGALGIKSERLLRWARVLQVSVAELAEAAEARSLAADSDPSASDTSEDSEPDTSPLVEERTPASAGGTA